MQTRSESSRYPISFGKYQLLERLAIGGMAELFRAQASGDHGFKKTLVIKRILPHLAADKHFTSMFINEAKITAQLIHPKIAQTYELGDEEGQLFIAMEYVDGLDALALLRELAHKREHLPVELAVYVVHEIVDALDFAHKQVDANGTPLGVVHRDVSPSNVLMSKRGDVKLVDFGIAQAVQQEHHTKSGTLKGKYGYMSPEQVVGGEVTARSDLFSAGVVLSEMLMGRRLFAAPNELDVLLMVRDVHLARLDRFGGEIDPDLMLIIRKCLQKEPSDRFADAAELREALADWLFSKRHRVTPKQIAELVERHFEAARTRQEKAMAEVSVMAPLPAAPETSPAPAKAKSESLATGGELAELVDQAVAAAGPDETDFSDIMAEVEGGTDNPAKAPPPAPAPAPAPAKTASAQSDSSDSFVELSLDDVDLSTAKNRADEKSGAKKIPEAPAVDDAPPGIAAHLRRSRTSKSAVAQVMTGSSAVPTAMDSAKSSRYASIEAAVASLSVPEVDPSSRDFDDREITAFPRASVKRQMLDRPPQAQPVVDVERPEPPRLKKITEAPAETGDLSKVSPMFIICDLALGKVDGLLVLEVGGTRKEVFFVDGTPEFVSSNVAKELFGEYLVSEGVISGGELDMALAMMPHYGGKLGDTLVGLGLVRPLDVFRHLTRQVRHKLIDVCTWQSGNYAWYPNRDNPRDSFPLDIDAFEVVGAGGLALPPMILTDWIEENGKRRIAQVAHPNLQPERFQLGEDARDVYDQLTGELTLTELCLPFKNPRERGRFVRIIYLYVAVGLADWVD